MQLVCQVVSSKDRRLHRLGEFESRESVVRILALRLKIRVSMVHQRETTIKFDGLYSASVVI